MADATNTQATEGTTPQQTEGAGSKAQTFEPIKTQADFDEAFNKRWAREKSKYDDYDTYKASHEELEQLKEANKSEVEKLRGRAEKAEAKLKEAEQREQLQAWKREAEAETGIKAELLHGNTKEDILKHANSIKEAYAPKGVAAGVVKSEGKTPATPGKSKADMLGDVLGI